MSERVRKLLFRGLIGALALIVIIPAITTVAFVFTHPLAHGNELRAAGAVARAIAAFCAAGLALVLAWRGGEREDVKLLALVVALWPTLISGDTYYGPGFPRWAADTLALLRDASGWAGVFAIAAFARLSALLPIPLDPAALDPRPRKWTLRWVRRVRLATLRPREVWGVAFTIAIIALLLFAGLGAEPENMTYGFPLFVGILLLSTFEAAVRNLVHSYRLADLEQRKRVFWLFEGLLLFVAGVLVIPMIVGGAIGMASALEINVPPANGLSQIFENAACVAAVTCIAFATFYRGAIDPRFLVRNTAIYGVLAVVLLAVFVGLENLVATQISRALGLSSGVGTWITGIISALSIAPLHGWLRRKILPPAPPADAAFARPEVELSLSKK